MWLSKRIVHETPPEEAATIGTVSIGGAEAAVVTDGEKRNARLISPGGYSWQPEAADSVLVIRGNELYVAGALNGAEALAPGELRIYSHGAEIRLKNDGKIELVGCVEITGDAFVNGKRVKTE